MEVGMARKKVKVNKEPSTAIRLSIPSELWRKFRAGCLYMDKDINGELNRLLENWGKEGYRRIRKAESLRCEQNIEDYNVETSPFSSRSGYSNRGGEGSSCV